MQKYQGIKKKRKEKKTVINIYYQASPKRVVSGSADGTIRIWDLICATQQVITSYVFTERSVTTFLFVCL